MVRTIGKPVRKYRIIIQERKTECDKVEKSRSFMIYDYEKKSNIDKIKEQLEKIGK
ncbi:unnamed protein product [marine sediment metagenome]|uniref:Uncharacterized protein n=1 Tax=marine sediment metagenome TaxID=412755 RepID=X1D4X1_9ZZZZ